MRLNDITRQYQTLFITYAYTIEGLGISLV
jgi:hypothetical protein